MCVMNQGHHHRASISNQSNPTRSNQHPLTTLPLLTAALPRPGGLEGGRGNDEEVAGVVQGHVGAEEGVLADGLPL